MPGKHLIKAASAILLGMICLLLGSSPMRSYVLSNSNSEGIYINALLQDECIVVSITPESKEHKPGSANNGEYIKKAQIWGNYGSGWFLIKDYGYDQKNLKEGSQQFKWDLRSLDISNESFYLDQASNSYSNTYNDSDMFKVYVKYDKNYSGGNERNNLVELYKTFYLGRPMQEINLLTDSEKAEYAPISYDFPVVATQGSKVELYLNADRDMEGYKVKITGDKFTQQIRENTDGKNTAEKQKVFEWIPKESGTFYIEVYDSKPQCVLKRKVYVNSENNDYLKLGDLSISSVNNVVCVRLKVEDNRPSGFDADINASLRVVISEPFVWSKTIKNYGDIVAFNEQYKAFELNEEREGFWLGSGNYYISAFIKSPHSIEPDDAIVKSYAKSSENSVPFELSWQCINGSPDKYGSYFLKKKEPLDFYFQVKERFENYEYAYFLKDARGKRLVKDYSHSADFHWSPADPGEYMIYARIRQIEKSGSLPNSYVKELSIPIKIQQPEQLIKLTSVRLNGNEWSIENGKAVKVKNGESIKSHMLNVIEIHAEDRGNQEKSTLMYKINTLTKGYQYTLTPYTFSNYIPFYPKDTGELRLIVMVKDSISGSDEDKCEILINVE